MTELKKKEDITVKEWKSQMMDLNKKRRDEMKKLLTREQKDQLEKMKGERKKMAEINAKARDEKMKLRLNLNDEQAEKLKKQRTEIIEKLRTIKENQALDNQKKREEIKALMEKRKENLKSTLTEEQLKKMKEMKENRKSIQKKRRVLS